MNHVVIVGGGFAGLNCARKLAAYPDIRITLVDKNNFQQFQPLLYQVATAVLAPSNAAFSLRSVLRHHPNVDVKLGEAVSVDLKTRAIETAEGQKYQGDYLVLAAGSQPNFFGTPGADKHTYPLYSLHDAELLRSRIVAVLESADRDPSLIAKGALNFVIVGAGPTGTELAGTIGDMTRRVFKDVYKDLDLSKAQIFLVDHGHSVLNAFSQKSQVYAASMLEQRGVQVRLGIGAKEVGPDHVLLSDGTKILTRTVIWAGGLKASKLSDNVGLSPGHGGRLDVQPDFGVKDFPDLRAGRFCEHRWRGRQTFAAARVRGGTVRQMVCKKHCRSHRWETRTAFPLLGQRNHGDDRAQRGRGGSGRASPRTPGAGCFRCLARSTRCTTNYGTRENRNLC
jgi:NADH:ubiquinone reductase (H+-translocating)